MKKKKNNEIQENKQSLDYLVEYEKENKIKYKELKEDEHTKIIEENIDHIIWQYYFHYKKYDRLNKKKEHIKEDLKTEIREECMSLKIPFFEIGMHVGDYKRRYKKIIKKKNWIENGLKKMEKFKNKEKKVKGDRVLFKKKIKGNKIIFEKKTKLNKINCGLKEMKIDCISIHWLEYVSTLGVNNVEINDDTVRDLTQMVSTKKDGKEVVNVIKKVEKENIYKIEDKYFEEDPVIDGYFGRFIKNVNSDSDPKGKKFFKENYSSIDAPFSKTDMYQMDSAYTSLKGKNIQSKINCIYLVDGLLKDLNLEEEKKINFFNLKEKKIRFINGEIFIENFLDKINDLYDKYVEIILERLKLDEDYKKKDEVELNELELNELTSNEVKLNELELNELLNELDLDELDSDKLDLELNNEELSGLINNTKNVVENTLLKIKNYKNYKCYNENKAYEKAIKQYYKDGEKKKNEGKEMGKQIKEEGIIIKKEFTFGKIGVKKGIKADIKLGYKNNLNYIKKLYNYNNLRMIENDYLLKNFIKDKIIEVFGIKESLYGINTQLKEIDKYYVERYVEYLKKDLDEKIKNIKEEVKEDYGIKTTWYEVSKYLEYLKKDINKKINNIEDIKNGDKGIKKEIKAYKLKIKSRLEAKTFLAEERYLEKYPFSQKRKPVAEDLADRIRKEEIKIRLRSEIEEILEEENCEKKKKNIDINNIKDKNGEKNEKKLVNKIKEYWEIKKKERNSAAGKILKNLKIDINNTILERLKERKQEEIEDQIREEIEKDIENVDKIAMEGNLKRLERLQKKKEKKPINIMEEIDKYIEKITKNPERENSLEEQFDKMKSEIKKIK